MRVSRRFVPRGRLIGGNCVILRPFYWHLEALAEEVVMSSIQHKLDRVRRPRVQITYDVETNGAMQKVELPFVVGVLADLSGQPKEPLKPLKDRKVVNIDRDNFNDVLAKADAAAWP